MVLLVWCEAPHLAGEASVLPIQADTARLRLHLYTRCLYSAPALPQHISGCQGKLEKPCGPAGSWEAANGAGPRWGRINSASLHLPNAKSLSVWFQESSLHLCPQAWNLLNQISEANSSLKQSSQGLPCCSLAAGSVCWLALKSTALRLTNTSTALRSFLVHVVSSQKSQSAAPQSSPVKASPFFLLGLLSWTLQPAQHLSPAQTAHKEVILHPGVWDAPI